MSISWGPRLYPIKCSGTKTSNLKRYKALLGCKIAPYYVILQWLVTLKGAKCFFECKIVPYNVMVQRYFEDAYLNPCVFGVYWFSRAGLITHAWRKCHHKCLRFKIIVLHWFVLSTGIRESVVRVVQMRKPPDKKLLSTIFFRPTCNKWVPANNNFINML